MGAALESTVVMATMTIVSALTMLRDRTTQPATWRARAWVAWLGVSDAMNVLLFFAAVRLVISVAVLVHYLTPVLVAVTAPFVLREKLTRRTAMAVVTSMAGLAVVLAPASGPSDRAAAWWAAGFAAGSAVFYASNVLVNKLIASAFSPSEAMFWHGVVATPLLAVMVPRVAWATIDSARRRFSGARRDRARVLSGRSRVCLGFAANACGARIDAHAPRTPRRRLPWRRRLRRALRPPHANRRSLDPRGLLGRHAVAYLMGYRMGANLAPFECRHGRWIPDVVRWFVMRPAWSICTLAAASVMVVAFAGCANIWGFQDGIEREVDATTDEGGSIAPQPDANEGATPDGSDDAAPDQAVIDAAPDALGDAGADAADAAAVLQDASSDEAEADGQAVLGDASSTCDASCAPAAPAGWTGPFALYEAPPPGPPACPGAYPAPIDNGLEGLDAGAAQCTCACGVVAGASCGPPVVDLWSDSNCTASCSQPFQPIGTTCTRPNFGFNCGGGGRFTLEGGAPSGGSCAPDGGTALPAPVWQLSALLCGLPPAVTPSECAGGGVCVPTPNPAGVLCISQTGGSQCPSGAYSVPHTYYKSSSDGRSCTPCNCGPPTRIVCSPTTVTAFGTTNCSGGSTRETAPMGCSGDHIASAIAAASTPSGGSCAPVGGQPDGSVTPAAGRTVCCTQ